MIYTDRLQRAIDFSVKVHAVDTDQKRKGTSHITHPLSVALILAAAGAGEDTIVAGLLHDTVEDSKEPNKITIGQLETMFGFTVARVVSDVTEHNKSLSWEERKRLVWEHISKMSKQALLVKSADLLHNLGEQVIDYERSGEEIFSRFNASRESVVEKDEKTVQVLKEAWGDNPLLRDLYLMLARGRDLLGN